MVRTLTTVDARQARAGTVGVGDKRITAIPSPLVWPTPLAGSAQVSGYAAMCVGLIYVLLELFCVRRYALRKKKDEAIARAEAATHV